MSWMKHFFVPPCLFNVIKLVLAFSRCKVTSCMYYFSLRSQRGHHEWRLMMNTCRCLRLLLEMVCHWITTCQLVMLVIQHHKDVNGRDCMMVCFSVQCVCIDVTVNIVTCDLFLLLLTASYKLTVWVKGIFYISEVHISEKLYCVILQKMFISVIWSGVG